MNASISKTSTRKAQTTDLTTVGDKGYRQAQMVLEIPKEDTGAIATIKGLSSASIEKFISALKGAPLISDPQEMAAHIAKQIPSIPVERLIPMLTTLYTLYHIRELSGVPHPRFLKDLVSAIRNAPDLQVPSKELPKFQSLLERLLGIDSLNMISKAARLQRDGERLYCNAKILSDIRPVFSQDPTVRPLGAVLTHTLKIGFHKGSDHRELHVILDSNDLTALDEVIHRARAKDRTLRELMKNADLASLDE